MRGSVGPVADAPSRRSPLLTWGASFVGAAVLLWLASQKLELWPETLVIERIELLYLAIAVHVPYALVRALRLRYVLDPLVERASEGRRTSLSTPLLYGSGLVSFFVVILLPLRLGELSRPLLLARGREPGVGVPESIGAVAVERVVDGLMVVGMLFVGLAFSEPLIADAEVAERLDYVRWFGQVMAGIFAVGLVVLIIAGKAPARVARPVRGGVGQVSSDLGERLAALVERVAGSLAPLYELRQGLPFLLTSLLYWSITVGQLWLMLHACGLELGVAEACAVVAIVGLSIQLPGGPAQAGAFQVGTALALGLFLPPGPIGSAGSTFAALMYGLQVVGSGLLALPGLWLLARARRAGDVSEPGAER